MSYYNKAKDLYDMMGQGQVMEALEKHYAESVEVWEMPTGEVRNGKEAQRQAMAQWFGMIKEQHDGGYGSITSNEEERTTMVESWTDITMQDGNRMKMQEVAVQKWSEEGQIVKEQFYYHMGPPPQQNQ